MPSSSSFKSPQPHQWRQVQQELWAGYRYMSRVDPDCEELEQRPLGTATRGLLIFNPKPLPQLDPNSGFISYTRVALLPSSS